VIRVSFTAAATMGPWVPPGITSDKDQKRVPTMGVLLSERNLGEALMAIVEPEIIICAQ
jgi:hypothetical protein